MNSVDGESGPPVPAPRYHDAAQRHQQIRITDLVPTRKRVLLGLFALGASFIGVLLALHGLTQGVASQGALKFSVLNLQGPGNLAGWFASILMLKSAALAVVIYVLRRHRLDDYRARYRLWLWTACASILMSVDEVTGLHEDIQSLIVFGTNAAGPTSGISWWLGAWTLVVALMSVRLWFEIRDSRWSATMLAIAAGFWSVHLVSRMGWLPSMGITVAIVPAGAKLLGHLCFWLALSVYGRHVILDIEGKAPIRPLKARTSRKAKRLAAETPPEEEATDETPSSRTADRQNVMIDPPHASKRTDLGPHYSVGSTSRTDSRTNSRTDSSTDITDDEDDDSDGEGTGQRKLTRAERRKLRRRQG